MSGNPDVAMEVMTNPEAKSLDPDEVDKKETGKKQKSPLSYFQELLSNSVVTGVPQIVTAGSLTRKIFRIVVLTTCLGGFIYQAVVFMNIYKTYPSSLEVELKFTGKLPAPAVTVCNRNSVKRKEFCKAKKELCAKPTNHTQFCNMYPHHCNGNTTIDDLEFVITDAFIEATDVEKYGHGKDMLDECCLSVFPVGDQCRALSKKRIIFDENKVKKSCYTIDFNKLEPYSQAQSVSDFLQAGRNSCMLWSVSGTEDSYLVMINLDPNEITRPDKKPSAQAVVHSQNDPKNPFENGFTMEEGKQYLVTMRAFEENLLPAPYSTNCTENEKLGEYYNREECIDQCQKENIVKKCGCTPLPLLVDEVPLCDEYNALMCLYHLSMEEDTCYEKCPRPCYSNYFQYEVSSSRIENSIKPVDLGDGPIQIDGERLDEETASGLELQGGVHGEGKALLKVLYSKKERTVYTYKPKYEKIEILGYIGGFSGIWLGVSLVAVFDFFETIIVFIVHIIRMAKTKEHGRR